MKRIVVSVTNDLFTDQRVNKVCLTLVAMNFDVLVIGRQLKNSQPLNRPYKTFRFKLIFNKGFLFYAEYNLRLFFKLLILKKDILLANDLDTLLPNFLVSKISKLKLVYDSHELFTEVPELINRPFVRNFWMKIEKNIVPKVNYCYTVSNSISEYYNSIYKTNFVVIRNLPIQTKTNIYSNFPFKTNQQKIIIYQGAINKGRGLELIINTMNYLDNTIFVMIGNGDIELKISQKIIENKLHKKVFLLNRIEPEELKKLTPLADLGISLEEDLGLNYRFALPNKLFDYIQAKIPVLVSDLTEMKTIISTYEVGETVQDRNPKMLAKQIKKILDNGKLAYTNHLKKAALELNWQNEKYKLIKLIESIES